MGNKPELHWIIYLTQKMPNMITAHCYVVYNLQHIHFYDHLFMLSVIVTVLTDLKELYLLTHTYILLQLYVCISLLLQEQEAFAYSYTACQSSTSYTTNCPCLFSQFYDAVLGNLRRNETIMA